MRARQGQRLVFDIETAGGLKRHPSSRELLCLGLYDGTESFIIPEDQFLGGAWLELYDLLKQVKLIGHNGKFDTMTLSWYLLEYHDPLWVEFDTQLAHAALYPAAQKHALDYITEKFYGWKPWSLENSQYENMRGVDKEELYAYLAKDIEGTGRLAQDLWSMIAHNPRAAQVMSTVMMPTTNMLAWMEWFGITVDTQYIEKELLPDVLKDIEEAKVSVQLLADLMAPDVEWPRVHGPGSVKGKPVWVNKFNPGSPKQVKDLYDARGIAIKGTDIHVMKALMEKGDEFAPVLVDFRKADKLRATYVEPNLTEPPLAQSSHLFPGQRRFPTYKLFGVVTGRTAAADPNIQNQPRQKRIRRMYIASTPRRRLMQSDYKQAELRVMAALGKDQWLIDIFNDPSVDVFDQMLPMAFPNRVPKDAEEAKEMRAKLKGVIYGLSFGRQAKAIGNELKMPPADAQAIINRFLGAAIGLADWRRSVFTRLHDGSGLQTRFGRYFQNDVITPKNRAAIERSALSFEPQSCSSDCLLISAVKLVNYIRENDLPWRPVALVHDSITLDIPIGDEEESSEITRGFMVETAAEWFPEVAFAADGKAGYSWDQTG